MKAVPPSRLWML